MPVRLVALYAGLAGFGFSSGLLILSTLGNTPWDVLHQGLALHIPLSIGTIAVGLSLLLLLLWIPLRQRPGLGTLSNALLVGPFIDLTLRFVPEPDALWLQLAYMAAGIVINGAATVLYIIPAFGPGPRDGLMTGLVERTGRPVLLVRSCIEVLVMAAGWLLGGRLFIGTLLYAFGIGPVTQAMLRLAARVLHPPDPFASDDT
ncbi:hypothetical protein GSY69_00935 [Brevibacterium sp. 5221]|uniref:YitT family protein n=1 Tax=Brevibacterium rongguiense TaxID=2695267 RepID=A0A6N9H3T1_9MICO|nr:hypothetical protein [Brevibacterium rongguiense]